MAIEDGTPVEPDAVGPEPDASELVEHVEEVPEPPVTGDDEVDLVVTELARAAGEPLEQRLAGFESAHRTLQNRLADVEG